MLSSETMYLIHVYDLIADEGMQRWQNRREEFFYLYIYFVVFSGCDSPLEVFYKLINSWNVFFHILLKINDLYIVENFYLLTIECNLLFLSKSRSYIHEILDQKYHSYNFHEEN